MPLTNQNLNASLDESCNHLKICYSAFRTSGRLNLSLRVPDTVTQWSIKSSAWTPGDVAVCHSTPLIVLTEKKLYMTVDVPQHVYINESVSARVSIFAEQIEEDLTVNFI